MTAPRVRRQQRSRRNVGTPSSRRALGFEALEHRTLLTLQVTSVTPTLVVNNAFNYIDVTFNEAIDPTTFTPAEVTITGPSGAVEVNSIALVGGNTYQANFSSLSVRGDYATSIGPGITDTSGNPMSAPVRHHAGIRAGQRHLHE